MHFFLGIKLGKAVAMYAYTQNFNRICDANVRGKPSSRFHFELKTSALDMRFYG